MFAYSGAKAGAGGWALLIVALLTPNVAAGWLGLRNDLGRAVVVQSATEADGTVRRGIPQTLDSGEATWTQIAPRTVKRFTIYDSRPPRAVLYQLDVSDAGEDQFFIIQEKGKSVEVVKSKAPERRSGDKKPGRNSHAHRKP